MSCLFCNGSHPSSRRHGSVVDMSEMHLALMTVIASLRRRAEMLRARGDLDTQHISEENK